MFLFLFLFPFRLGLWCWDPLFPPSRKASVTVAVANFRCKLHNEAAQATADERGTWQMRKLTQATTCSSGLFPLCCSLCRENFSSNSLHDPNGFRKRATQDPSTLGLRTRSVLQPALVLVLLLVGRRSC